jgi:FSR family fosmidomycin resistance protein-like MFS transporter
LTTISVPATGKFRDIQKAAFFSLIFAHAVNDMAGAFFAPLLPLIQKELGLSLTAVGLIMSIRSLSSSLPQPLFGWLTDRFPSPMWLLATPLIVGPFRTAIGFATGFWSLVSLLSIGAIAGACFHPAAAVRARAISSTRRGLVMAAYVASGRIGHACGPIVGLSIVSVLGLKGLIVASAFYVASLIVLKMFPPMDETEVRKQKTVEESSPDGSRENWRPFALLYVINIFRSMLMMNLNTFIPLFITSVGGSLWMGGSSLAIFVASGGLGGIIGGWLSDRIGRKSVIAGSALLLLPTFLLFLHSEGALQFAIILPLGILVYCSMGVSMAFAQELLPNRPALAASLMQGGNWFIASFTIAGMGVLGDWLGIQQALQWLVVVICLDFVISLMLPGRERIEPGASTSSA